jgi:hypothetical protein
MFLVCPFQMVVLVGYALFIHVISCFVLYGKYNWFHGKLVTPTAPPPPTSLASFHQDDPEIADGNGDHSLEAPEGDSTMEA